MTELLLNRKPAVGYDNPWVVSKGQIREDNPWRLSGRYDKMMQAAMSDSPWQLLKRYYNNIIKAARNRKRARGIDLVQPIQQIQPIQPPIPEVAALDPPSHDDDEKLIPRGQYERALGIYGSTGGKLQPSPPEGTTSELLSRDDGEKRMLRDQFQRAFAVYESTGGKRTHEDMLAIVDARLAAMTPAEIAWVAKEVMVDMVLFPELGEIETVDAAVETVRSHAAMLQEKLPKFDNIKLGPRIADDLTGATIEDIVGRRGAEPTIAFVGRRSHTRYGGSLDRQKDRAESSDVNLTALSPDENLIRYLNMQNITSILAYDFGACVAQNFQMTPVDDRILESGIDSHNNRYQVFVDWSPTAEMRGKVAGAIK